MSIDIATKQSSLCETMRHNAGAAKHVLGFTLVEILVTIAVASVLLAVAVPSFNELVVSNRLTTQSNDMVAAINFARSEAIKRNRSISLCRTGSATATDCAAATATWEHWIVRTSTGTVVRRGVVNTYGNKFVVRSTLGADEAVFGSDGLVRTAGAIVNDHQLSVCATNESTNNIRRIVLGAGSRISTDSLSGGC